MTDWFKKTEQGSQLNLKCNLFASSLVFFSTMTVIYRYLFGLHAFGLEETNFYREAEKQARKVQCSTIHDNKLVHIHGCTRKSVCTEVIILSVKPN